MKHSKTRNMQSTLLAAALTASLLITTTVFAPSSLAQTPATKLTKSQSGFYRLKLGDVNVTALSDGTIPLDTKLLNNLPKHKLNALLKQSFVTSPLDTSVNAYLIEQGEKLILVDSGTGVLFGPTLNKLPASLRAIGYSPEQVTDILITHVHTDHTGGLMDGATRVFPKAIVHVDQREIRYWLDPVNKERAPAGQKQFFDQAKATIGPYVDAGQVKTFDGAVELFPGLRSLPAPGHTPGHSFYVLESKSKKLVFWGDIMHMAEVQFPDPSVTIQFDVDTKAAAVQRKLAFADAAKQGYLVAPAHVSFPGVGHLRKEGVGYRWFPVPFVNDALPIESALPLK